MSNQETRPSATDIEEIFSIFAKKAVSVFNRIGYVPPQLIGVVLNDEEQGQVDELLSLEPEVIAAVSGATQLQGALRPIIDLFLQEGSPLRTRMAQDGQRLPAILVQIDEIWYSDIGEDSSDSTRLLRPSEQPDRKEGIVVIIHTASTSHPGICPILPEPMRHAVMGQLMPAEGVTVMGPAKAARVDDPSVGYPHSTAVH